MTHKFKQGQLILVRLETRGDMHYLWNTQQYMAESGEHMFFLGGYILKEGYEFLPFEGNEHLLGTRNDPAPQWEPKADEFVAVRQNTESTWVARRFIKKNGPLFRCHHESGVDTTCWKFCEPLRKHFNVPKE